MKEFIETLIGRLEEESKKWLDIFEKEYRKGNYDSYSDGMNDAFEEAIQIVNQLAEEYNPSKSSSLEKQPEESQPNFYAERFNRVL